MKNSKEKGITLVALVVTVIILLILAGVTINIALSENGLFQRAKNAADRYKVAQTNEQDLLTNLYRELDQYSNIATPTTPTTPTNPPKEGEGPNGKPLVTTVTTTDHETIKAEDKLGNPVTVPGTFKVVEGETVEDGIVIEDADKNQFVWIPVSNINGNNDGNGTGLITRNDGSKVEITLGRYEFANSTQNGKEILKQSGANRSERSDSTKIDSNFYEDTSKEGRPNGGAGAKDLAGFVTSVETNHGYYIARYEASFGSGDAPKESYGSDGNGITHIMTNQKPAIKPTKQDSDDTVHTNGSETSIKAGDLWRYITQEDSSIVCRNMYSNGNESSYVESDLVNSYAWDTAIVYIQKMGHSNYANETCETNGNKDTFKNTGDTGDEVCHIFDMAGNVKEWTTEYSTYTINYLSYECPCVFRGGFYYSSDYCTASRSSGFTAGSNYIIGFRPLLYLK